MSILGPQVFKLCAVEPNRAYSLRPNDHRFIEQSIVWWSDGNYKSGGDLNVASLGVTLSGTHIGTVNCNQLLAPATDLITVSKPKGSDFWFFDSDVYELKDDWKEHISEMCLANILKHESKINRCFSLARQIKESTIK